MEQRPLAERVAAVSSLDDPIRRALFDHVSRSDAPVSRDQAAAALGVTRSKAAFHLDRLVDEGLLTVEFKRLTGRTGPAVRRLKEIHPISPPIKATKLSWQRQGVIYDLGQNMVGVVRIKVKADRGTTIRLRHAEMLDQDNALYVANLRTAEATDYYTCKGEGEETWTPRFTFHGFRYVELCTIGDGAKMELNPADGVVGLVMHSDTPETGSFECSDPLISKLQQNIQWGQRGNFLEVPTDCPQRDERLG
jgi:alpha-L-rhamnosidase